VESDTNSPKRRRQCPICASRELTRLDGHWLEKIIDRVAGIRKYKCFMCGHVFELRVTREVKARARSVSDD
jgi:DNA-directed RNA polymerase subunit RPC12/RpoP